MIVSESGRRRWRSPCQSNVSSTTTHLGGRTTPSVGRQEPAGQRAGVRVDQPSLRVEALALAGIERAVGLEMVKLAGFEAGNEYAPDIAPAVVCRIEFDELARARGR